VEYLNTTNYTPTDVEQELINHAMFTIACFRSRAHKIHDMPNTSEQKRTLIKQIFSQFQIDLKKISAFLSQLYSTDFNFESLFKDRENPFLIDFEFLQREILQIFWASFKSFLITKPEDYPSNSSASLKKDKGLAKTSTSQLISECLATRQVLNFGALFYQSMPMGTLEQLYEITNNCILRMFVQSGELINKLEQSRIQGKKIISANGCDKQNQNVALDNQNFVNMIDNQYHIFTTLWYGTLFYILIFYKLLTFYNYTAISTLSLPI
jgi:hypothetical protein